MRRALVLLLLLAGCDGGGAGDAGLSRDARVDDDAGSDAGPSDAGPSDASTLDAGPPPSPLDGASEARLLRDGFGFLEGPHWVGDALLFTDIPRSTIHRFTPPDAFDVFRMPSGAANGLATLPDGRLLAAEHQNRRVSVTEDDGSVTSFAADFDGGAFHSPNDLAVRSDGTVYFTDPPYGLDGRPRELDFNGVFRRAPDGSVDAIWRGAVDSRPNGVALSPDESILYVALTSAGEVLAFDVAADGSASGERRFVDGTPNADGMAVDADGNLFVTTAEGVAVFAPDGARWGTLSVPETPANCAFGGADGATLFVTARTGLYAIDLIIPGA